MPIARVAAVLLCAAAAGGCFQMTTVVKVNSDGSGTIDHTLLVTKAALVQLRNFSALAGRGSQGQQIDLTSEDQARAMAETLGPGVAYVSSEPVDTPLGEGRHALYAFRDISQVRISQQPSTDGLPVKMDARSGDITCSMTHEPDGNAVLHINLPELNLPTNLGGTNGAGLAQQLALVRSLLAGARVSIGVEPEGRLVKTSSPYVDGGHVTLLEVNLDQVLGNQEFLTELQSATSPDEVKAALAKVSGLKLVLDREVTIEFTPAK